MAYDAFLKIEGLNDPSGRTANIEVLTFTVGVQLPAVQRNGFADGSVRPIAEDLVITKHSDSTSPHLYAACASGKHFPGATLMLVPAVSPNPSTDDSLPVPFLKYTLSGILIGLLRQAGGEQEDFLPVEEVSLSYQKITIDWGDGQSVDSFDFHSGRRG